jgi:hypothetical protein
VRACTGPARNAVPTENSESGEKSGVLGRVDLVSPACLSMCVLSSRLLPAGSAVGPLWNWRTSRSVISCTSFAASGRPGPGCLRLIACSGSGSTDYSRAAWTNSVGQAGDRRPMVASGLPPVLALALKIGTAVSGSRYSQADSADERRQPALGCAPDSRRIAQARHRDQPSHGCQVSGAKARDAFADLA